MAKTGNLHYATAGVEGGWGGPGTGLLGVSQRRRTDPVNWRVGLRAAGTTLFRSLPSTIKLPTPAGLWQKQEICTTPQREWRVGGGVPERACWGFPNAVGRTQSIGGWACGLPEQPCSALCPLQLSCPPQRGLWQKQEICTTPQREWRVGGGVPERACWGFPNAVGRTQSIGGWACGLPEQPCSALCPLQLSCPPQREYGKNRKSALRHSGSGGWVGGVPERACWGFPNAVGRTQSIGGWACGLPEQPCSALCPLQLSCPPQRDYGKNRKSALRHSGSGGWVGGPGTGLLGVSQRRRTDPVNWRVGLRAAGTTLFRSFRANLH